MTRPDPVPATWPSPTDPYAALRTTWAMYVSGGAIDPGDPAFASSLRWLSTTTARQLAAMRSGRRIKELWPDLPLGSASGNLTASFRRLKTMAQAYATPGTSYTGDTALAASIAAGLDFLTAGPYAPKTKPYGNWWDWQIGAAQAFQDAAVLIYDTLTAAQISSYCAALDAFVSDPRRQMYLGRSTTFVTSEGTNRLDLCRVAIVRGALGGDSAAITDGVAAISDTLPLVLHGNGIYPDYSYKFHQDIAYTGTYGTIFFFDVAALVLLLNGSPWAITDPNLATVYDAVTGCLAPMVYNGLMLDGVRGRAISRPHETDAQDGYTAAITLLLYAQALQVENPARAAVWRSIALGWLERNTVTKSGAFGIYGIALAESVRNDASIVAAPEPVAHQQFPNMARVVHRRPGWAYSLAMCSAHVSRYEAMNGENLRGWFTGDGMGQLYLDNDVAQFNDAFWSTVNPYLLPGTTADQGALPDAAGQATQPNTLWVGGSVVNGGYGAVGMQLQAHATDLTAVKSWFCLDTKVVALGAGITSSSGNHVVTTVENRNLHRTTSTTVALDGRALTASPGWAETISGVRSACIDGVAGYCFFDSNQVALALTNRTGNWRDINTSTPARDDDTRPYLSIALDHGRNPTNATYAYAILPLATQAQTTSYAANPTVSILSNTPTVQAISDQSVGVTMANFFAAATIGPIAVSAPSSVSIQHFDGRLTIAVSDPTWTQAVVEVAVAAPGYGAIVAADPTVAVRTGDDGRIRLRVETGGSRGRNHSVTLSPVPAIIEYGE